MHEQGFEELRNIQFHDFGHLFELSVTYSFLYSTINSFSDKVLEILAYPFKTILLNIENYVSAIAEKSSVELSENLQLSKDFKGFSQKFDKIKNFNSDDFEYNSIFKQLYLVSALYSLSILIIGGISAYYSKQYLYQFVFIFSTIILFHYIFQFIISFFVSLIKNNFVSKYGAFFLFLIFMVLTIILNIIIEWDVSLTRHCFAMIPNSFWYYSYKTFHPSQNCISIYSLVIALFPFILHFFRISIHLISGYMGKAIKLYYDMRRFASTLVEKANLEVQKANLEVKLKSNITKVTSGLNDW